jgi:hypothetical protein
MVANELKVQLHTNNKNMLRGVYFDSFPFNQIVTIIYLKNAILFNSRNACIGYNGKLGIPPFGFKASQKLFLLFKKNIENNMTTLHKKSETKIENNEMLSNIN